MVTRLLPIAAAGVAIAGVFAIVLAPGDFDEIAELAVAGGASPARLSPVFTGKDTERRQLPVDLQLVTDGLPQITDIQAIPGHPTRLVILQKTGQASLLDLTTTELTPWFELPVHTRSEMGLLGIAFGPKFESTGVFYTHHNPPNGERGQVTRWTVNPQLAAPPAQGPLILNVLQPYRNHDGGQLQTGPDGSLYVALGDGGSGFDPQGHGQNTKSLLGTILRILPNAKGGYNVPRDNPFVDDPDVHDAIFAYGLRNPWRFAFTPDGRIVAGDVGQGEQEEVDLVPAGGNLGWANMEGNTCITSPCEGFVDPIWTYGRDDGNSITGGVVAAGSGIATLEGKYVLGDFGSGRLWALDLPDQPGIQTEGVYALGKFRLQPSTFGVDAAGRIYVGDFTRGALYRLVSHAEAGP